MKNVWADGGYSFGSSVGLVMYVLACWPLLGLTVKFDCATPSGPHRLMLGFAFVWIAELPFGVAGLWWERRHGISKQGYLDLIVGSFIGLGSKVDELEVGMNRAAEQATPQAKRIFLAALKKMTFDDARHILTGNDTAATDYFKRTSTPDLTTAFAPIVHTSMQRVGVVGQYDRFLQTAPGGAALANEFDLDKYVVGKTLDGLFYMLGEEEKKIRKNPAAQTTQLLKQVFGRTK